MTDTAAIEARVKEFLRFANREHGASLTFGVVFDAPSNKWLAAIGAGGQQCEFPPGAGRRMVRGFRDRASTSVADLTDQMRHDMGASEFGQVFEKMDQACKLAMERNAMGVKPQFVAPPSFN